MKRVLLLLGSLLLLSLGGCTNQTTEEGFVGYIYHVPLAVGEAEYVGTQHGPTSTGVVWRQFVINVDVRPKTYTEDFHILSRDNLNVGFEAHGRIAIRGDVVRELIEAYDAENWYNFAVRQPFRTAVRDVVHKYDAYDIQAQTQQIGNEILTRLQDEYAGTPISFETMSIGNLTYPDAINAEIQRKLAAEQDLGRMERERQIAEQEAQILVTEARGRAAAQRIVNETLTPLYVQHEMLQGFRELSRSERATFVAAPTGDSGGAPVVLGLDR